MTYENLDRLADAFVPGLAIVLLLLWCLALLGRRFVLAARLAALFAIGLVLVYGTMWLDARLGLWPSFGLDYSTHTAAATMLALLLAVARRSLRWLWTGATLAYLALCLYQRYHSVADIATTALYLVPLMWLASRVVLGNWQLRA